ncbi:MAG TPA: response regulator [Polyangiaceae bacterium]|nr:response regulator [Polyangiaceae bacterium]
MTTPDGAPSSSRSRARVLLIDDEPGNLLTFRRVFSSLYDITLASSAKEALMRLDAATGDQAFDVVLLDFAMPEMNGAHFLESMRKKHATLPCLFLTAYAELEEVKKVSGRYLVAAVIAKPWEKHDVEHRIDLAVRMSRMKRSSSRLRT